MNKTIIYSISDYLARAVSTSYKKAKSDVVNSIKETIIGAYDDKLPSYLSIEYSSTDKKFLKNFEKECFTVACVGTYELEEKLKKAALEILELPETNTKNRFEMFIAEAHNLMSGYLPPEGKEIPPPGWLKTNLQTAVNSSYNASQWQKLQDPAVKGLYPAYKYKTREDSKVRDEHRILNDSVFSADDPIWHQIYPPNGWNCRCYINYLSHEDIKLPGNQSLTLSNTERSDIVKQAKISPEFNRNSGETGSIFGKWLSSKLNDMPKEKVKEIEKLQSKFIATADRLESISDPEIKINKTVIKFKEYEKAFIEAEGITFGNDTKKNEQGNYDPNPNMKRININDKVKDAQYTSLHEFGHALDDLHITAEQRKSFAKMHRNKNNLPQLERIIHKRIAKQGGALGNLTLKDARLLLKGETIKAEDGSFWYLSKKEIKYIRTKSEMLAEGYAQFRTMKDFNKIAVDYHKFFNEITKSLINKYGK